MDLSDPKTFKTTYLSIAAVIMLCAVLLAVFQQYYIGVALIVFDSIIIFIGSMVFSHMVQVERLKQLEKM